MPIVTMTSKSFLKKFVCNEKDDVILDASYLLASERIRYGQACKDQCQKMFWPSAYTIMSMSGRSSKLKYNAEYVDRYMKELDEIRGEMATILKMTLKKDLLTVIMSTPMEEDNLHLLKMIRQYYKREFDYDVIDYDKEKSIPKEKPETYSNIIKDCKSVISKERTNKIKKMMKTERGRREYYSSLSKKKLKRLLKKESLYLDGMGLPEMIEMAMTFL